MGGDLTLYLPGDPIPGYLAAPSDGPPWPGIVVLHQAFGLDDDIRRITDRLATMGYLAVAPDLLADRPLRCLARIFADIRRGWGTNVEQVAAVTDWLKGRADCTGVVGVIGFCLGGGLAYLLGCSGAVKVTASNYGKAPPPHMLARSCPVVASYGGRDRVYGAQAAEVVRTLLHSDIDHDVKVYPGVGHGFLNHDDGGLVASLGRPFLATGYDREAAEDAWGRIAEFFARYL
ncbi:MAG: dienelactone hydrolase family protein [Actinomycetota bacterium]